MMAITLKTYGGGGGKVFLKNGLIYKKSYALTKENNKKLLWYHSINPDIRLRKQYEWLKRIRNYNDLSIHFAEIVSSKVGNNWFEYSMRNIQGKTITNQMLHNDNFRRVKNTIYNAALFARNSLHTKNIRRNLNKNYFVKNHMQKLNSRINALIEIYPTFRPFFENDYITINGKRLKNLPLIFKEIINDSVLLEKLQPESTCLVHGDLHLGNIFIKTNNNDFILLDPRGINTDPMYDISKLSHNTLGLYDFCLLRMFSLKVNSATNEVEVIFNVSDHTRSIYRKVHQFLIDLYKDIWLKSNPNKQKFLLQYISNNASHCIGAAPFQILESQFKKSDLDFIAIYSVGIYLFNRLLLIKNRQVGFEEAVSLENMSFIFNI